MQQISKQEMENQIIELKEQLAEKLAQDEIVFREIEEKKTEIEEAQKALRILDRIREIKGVSTLRQLISSTKPHERKAVEEPEKKKSVKYIVIRNDQGVFVKSQPEEPPKVEELDSKERTTLAKCGLSYVCMQEMRKLLIKIREICSGMDKSKKSHKELLAYFGELMAIKNTLLRNQREDVLRLLENLSVESPIRIFFSHDENEMEQESKGLLTLVSHELSRTGAPVVLADLARILKKNGWQVLFFSPVDGPLREVLNRDGITVIVEKRLREGFYSASYEPDTRKKLLLDHFVRESTLSIFNTAVLSNLIKRYMGSFHSILWWFHEGSEVLKEAGASLPRHLTSNIRPVCVCDYAYEQLEKAGVHYDREILLYGVENPKENCGQGRREEEEIIRFILAATIDYRKGQDLLAEAVARLPYSYLKKSEFYLVGHSFREDMAENLKGYAGTYKNFHLTGEMKREDLFTLYEKADCIVVPSRDDPMPVTLTEGMSRGISCLCSDHTGTAAYFKDGENGFVFPSEDVQALTEKLMEIMDKKEELERIGKAGRRLFEEIFDMDVFETKVEHLVERCRRTKRKPLILPASKDWEKKKTEELTENPLLLHETLKEAMNTMKDTSVTSYLERLKTTIEAQKNQRQRYAFLLDITTGEKKSEWYRLYHRLKKERAIKRGDYPKGMKLMEELPEGFSKKNCLTHPVDYLLPPNPVEEKISVIIPTYQAGEEFLGNLAALRLQKGISDLEILVVDSGSTDQTVEIAEFMGCLVHRIPKESFTHSGARNLGAKLATGEYFLFMTQDAFPASEYWLYHMLTVCKETGAAAVSSREIPKEDACLQARIDGENHLRFLELWNQDRICTLPKKQTYESLRKNAQLNDVNCLISRSSFEKYKYEGSFAEDLRLGLNLIKDGESLALISSVGVFHSHNRSAGYQLKRCFIDTYTLLQMFDDVPREKLSRQERFCGVLNCYLETVDFLERLRLDPTEELARIWGGENAPEGISEIHNMENPEAKNPLLEDPFICAFFDQLIRVYAKEKWTETTFFAQVEAYIKTTIPEWKKRQEAEGNPVEISLQELLDTVAKAFASNAGAHLAEIAAESKEDSRLAAFLKNLSKGV